MAILSSNKPNQERQVMTKQFIPRVAVCVACLALSAAAQTSTSSSTTSADQSSPSGSTPADQSSGQYGQFGHHFGAGRMGHTEIRATKIIGADIKSTQAQSLGTINDVIFNPASGRIDFAVISLSSTTGTETTPGATPSTSTSTTTASSTATAGKLVAVPWMLLRSAGAAESGASTAATAGASTSSTTGTSTAATTGSTMGQPTFTFAGDSSKLQSAPSFDSSNWPDITQPSWRQSIYAHFGMTPGASTGGATSPGGTESSTGSFTPPSPSSSTNTSSSPDSSSKPQ
jgi:sporulation protein YlmC with PRC-barrel domain